MATPMALFIRFVEPVHQRAFVIALAEIDVEAEFAAHSLAVRLYVLERLAAIDARFSLAQHIQVGPVQDKNRLRHRMFRLAHRLLILSGSSDRYAVHCIHRVLCQPIGSKGTGMRERHL